MKQPLTLLSMLLISACGKVPSNEGTTEKYKSDSMAYLSPNDPRIELARQKAQETLESLRDSFTSGRHERSCFVKVAVPTPDQSLEHIWVRVDIWEQDSIYGILANHPISLPNKLGDQIQLHTSNVEDWNIQDSNGKIIAGYYTSFLRQ